MASLNQVSLIGFVGDNPTVNQTKTNEYIASIRIATTERGFVKKDGTKKEDKTEWHNVVFFGSIAEKLIAPYVRKGSMVFVQGKLRTRTYDDRNGIKRYMVEIVGDIIQLLDRKPNQSSEPTTQVSANNSLTATASSLSHLAGTPIFGKGGIMDNGDTTDDLPF